MTICLPLHSLCALHLYFSYKYALGKLSPRFIENFKIALTTLTLKRPRCIPHVHGKETYDEPYSRARLQATEDGWRLELWIRILARELKALCNRNVEMFDPPSNRCGISQSTPLEANVLTGTLLDD